MKKQIPYSCQTIDEGDIQAVSEALRSAFLTQGPLVPKFEEDLARACNVKYALAVSSATAGLHLACLAAGLKAGDELITSSITFVASANCGLYCGADISLTDIDSQTLNMTVATLEKKLTDKTKVVIPVHMAGQSCEMKEIQSLVSSYSKKIGKRIYIVEDAAHALGGTYSKKPIGSCEFSDMSVLSFHPVKSLTTGEGGAVLTNDPDLYRLLSLLRSHGITKDAEQLSQKVGPWYYEQQELGYNYRLTDLQSALGSSQLKKLPQFIGRRREIAKKYLSHFSNKEGVRVPKLNVGESAVHLFILQIDYAYFGATRAELMERLARKSVGTQVHYIPLFKQPYFKNRFQFVEKDYPNANAYYDRCLSIPVFPLMTDTELEYVLKTLDEELTK